MQAVGSGVGGSSYQSTSNRMQHGVIIKEVAKHERANTQAPKEIKTVSAVERAMNSHKLDQTTKGSTHERSSASSSMQDARAKANEIKEKMLNESVEKAYDKANSSQRAGAEDLKKPNEKSTKSSEMQKARENKSGEEVKKQLVPATVAVSSTDVGSKGIVRSLTEVSKNAEILAKNLKTGATFIGMVMDINTMATSESDYKKHLAATTFMTSLTPLSLVAVGYSIKQNIAYDNASDEEKKRLDEKVRDKPTAYNQSLNKVEASKINKEFTKKINVGLGKDVPKIKNTRTNPKLKKQIEAARQMEKREAEKKAEARRKSLLRSSRRRTNRKAKSNKSSNASRSRRSSRNRSRSRSKSRRTRRSR